MEVYYHVLVEGQSNTVRFWPRLCKNVFERDRYSEPD